METQAQTIKAANETAEEQLNAATSKLLKAADDIAAEYKLPEGINGLTCAEFLGRMTFIVSMSRDLKRAGVDMLAAQSIKENFKAAKEAPPPVVATVKVPGEPPPDTSHPTPSADITSLAITVQAVKALKGAGIHMVSDLDTITDAGLMAIKGIASPSVAAIRQAVTQYRAK